MRTVEMAPSNPALLEDPLAMKRYWVGVVAEGLNISELEALKRIRRNNMLPLEEDIFIEDTNPDDNCPISASTFETVYPRYNANLVLLAEASPHFHGPRGPRPTLATAENLLRISTLLETSPHGNRKKLAKIKGPIKDVLLNLKLSASNPKNCPIGTEFDDDDIKRGINIPLLVDIPTAAAIGFAAASGIVNKRHGIEITGDERDFEFMENVRRVYELAFNFSPDQKIRPLKHKGTQTPQDYRNYRLSYISKALASYYVNCVGIPTTHEARRQVGIPNLIKDSQSQAVKDAFLAAFLGTKGTVDLQGRFSMRDVSKDQLEDIKCLIDDKVVNSSIWIFPKQGRNSHILALSVAATMELYIQGLLDANPRLRNRAKDFYRNKAGVVLKNKLRAIYGDLDEDGRLIHQITSQFLWKS